MQPLSVIILALTFMLTAPSTRASSGEVTFIHIGDLHGHLIPRQNMRKSDSTYKQSVGGLAYVYDQIKKIRKHNPNNLLINTGDTIQGSAETLFSQGQHIVDILNEFKIDAFTPGNWDFVYGTQRFIQLFSLPKPITNWNAIAANLYYVTLYEFPLTPYPGRAGSRVLPPYIIKKVGKLKIGIIGLTADRGPQVVSSRIMDGFYLSPGEEELVEAVSLLHKQEKVDLVVLLSERGLGPNLDMVERVPGVDIVFSSDMHEETHQLLIANTGTLLVEEGQDGTLVGELKVIVKNKKIVNWKWKAHKISTKNNSADPMINAMVTEARKTFIKGPNFRSHVNPISTTILRTPIDTVIGQTKVALHRSNYTDNSSMPAVIEGSSHDFLADAFKSACGADVGMMRGFRYGTHIAPGPIKLEDIYHFIPIGPQIACGDISGDDLRLRIEKSVDRVLTNWVGNWGGGWVIGLSGITYDLDPSNEYRSRITNMRINGELVDAPRMYKVAGYWYLDNADKINRMTALDITVLKNAYGGDVDAAEIVAYYLQSLPNQTVDPETNRVHLLKSLPKTISKNREIQPWRGVPRPNY